MPGLGFFLGVGFGLLGLVYLYMVLYVRDAIFGVEKQPYKKNGIALCILGVSLIARDTILPFWWFVYPLWAVAGYLAIKAFREIRSTGEHH